MAEDGLRGRGSECARLDGLLTGVRAGHSAALVMRGEAGVGKTALLDYLAGSAAGLRVLRVAGVESEMELAFAVLHQMCGPVLDRLSRLPEPQRAALGTAFGLQAGPPPDPFLIGLAVLSLLAEVAEDGPLVCVIDDARWLDRASKRMLAFVARLLVAESVLMIFRRGAVPEPAHGRVASAQGVHQARHQLPQAARRGPARPGTPGPADLSPSPGGEPAPGASWPPGR